MPGPKRWARMINWKIVGKSHSTYGHGMSKDKGKQNLLGQHK